MDWTCVGFEANFPKGPQYELIWAGAVCAPIPPEELPLLREAGFQRWHKSLRQSPVSQPLYSWLRGDWAAFPEPIPLSKPAPEDIALVANRKSEIHSLLGLNEPSGRNGGYDIFLLDKATFKQVQARVSTKVFALLSPGTRSLYAARHLIRQAFCLDMRSPEVWALKIWLNPEHLDYYEKLAEGMIWDDADKERRVVLQRLLQKVQLPRSDT